MRTAQCAAIVFLLASFAVGQTTPKAQPSNATRELTTMLNQFMRDASSNNRAGFERFFADDVIYTGSNGMVHTKADIMRSVNAPQKANAAEERQDYSAEDIVVRDFGDTAIVAFQLVARTHHAGGKIEISNYRDTGAFLRRNGRWQAIAWQATKMPEKTTSK